MRERPEKFERKRKRNGKNRGVDSNGEISQNESYVPTSAELQRELDKLTSKKSNETVFDTVQNEVDSIDASQARMEQQFLSVARRAQDELTGEYAVPKKTVWSNFDGNLPFSDRRRDALRSKQFDNFDLPAYSLAAHIEKNAALRKVGTEQETPKTVEPGNVMFKFPLKDSDKLSETGFDSVGNFTLKFPQIGLDYKGPINKETVENVIIPKVREALLKTGLEEEKVTRLIRASLERVSKGSNSTKVFSEVVAILENVELGLTPQTSSVQALEQEMGEIPKLENVNSSQMSGERVAGGELKRRKKMERASTVYTQDLEDQDRLLNKPAYSNEYLNKELFNRAAERTIYWQESITDISKSDAQNELISLEKYLFLLQKQLHKDKKENSSEESTKMVQELQDTQYKILYLKNGILSRNQQDMKNNIETPKSVAPLDNEKKGMPPDSEFVTLSSEEQLLADAWEKAVTEPEETKDIAPTDMSKQMSRLTAITKGHREKTGLSHVEALEANEEYAVVRSKIREIKGRMRKIEKEGETDESKAEIQKLRDELVPLLLAFRKSTRFSVNKDVLDKGKPIIDSRVETFDSLANQFETYKQELLLIEGEVGKNKLEGTAEALVYLGNIRELERHFANKDTDTFDAVRVQTLLKNINTEIESVKKRFGIASKQEEVVVPEASLDVENVGEKSVAPFEQNTYESRKQSREVWRTKKTEYEDTYRKYLEDLEAEKKQRGFFRKMEFWKKDEQPESLVAMQKEYQDVRRVYAESLEKALTSRFDRSVSVDSAASEGLRAGLANRFVLRAAHDRLKIEREFVPVGQAQKTLEGLKEVFKKHGRKIATASLLWTIGSGVVTGGLFGAAQALGGKALAVKLSAGGALAGAAVGGLIGGSIVYGRERNRDKSFNNAKTSFSTETLDALESNYIKNYKAYEQAARNQKVWAAGGAVLGALGGSALAGRLDAEQLMQNIPDFEFPLDPRLNIEVPSNGGSTPHFELPTEPDLDTPVTPVTPDVELVPEDDLLEHEKNIDNFLKGDEFMNPSVEDETNLPEELGSYTIQANDNFWDIAEGETDATPLPTFSEVSEQNLQATIDLTRDYLNENPDVAREIGFPVDGNIGRLYVGDELDLDRLEEVARNVAVENGFLSS